MKKKFRNTKSSERKERQRKATETANRIQKAISSANAKQDILAPLTAFCLMEAKLQSPSSILSSGTTRKTKLKVEFHSALLSKELQTYCLNLFQENMGDLYRSSSWGLNPKEKEREFQHEHARFLLVRQEDQIDYRDSTTDKNSSENGIRDDIVGFTHFRFEPDDESHPNEEVLYVYEVQIEDHARRIGLGRRLMSIMELIAMQNGMRKVV